MSFRLSWVRFLRSLALILLRIDLIDILLTAGVKPVNMFPLSVPLQPRDVVKWTWTAS